MTFYKKKLKIFDFVLKQTKKKLKKIKIPADVQRYKHEYYFFTLGDHMRAVGCIVNRLVKSTNYSYDPFLGRSTLNLAIIYPLLYYKLDYSHSL